MSEAGVLHRILLNASRQGTGAVIFFLTTMALSSSLGVEGYARYFASWNLALVIVAFSDLGLFTDTIRRLVGGQTIGAMATALWRPYVLQVVVVLAGSQCAYFWGLSPVTVTCIAFGVIAGNLLTAIALGKDWFLRFAVGELVQNASLLLAVLVLPPANPDAVGWYQLGGVAAKGAWYALSAWLRLGTLPSGAPLQEAEPMLALQRGRLAKAYVHSLLDIVVYRGCYLMLTQLLGPAMAASAVAWSLCDRALLIVLGVNQVLVPKMMRRALSPKVRWLTRSVAVAGFVAAVLGMAGVWTALRASGHAPGSGSLEWGTTSLLALAFVPMVCAQLWRAEALARERYARLFASHAFAIASLALAGAWLALARDPTPALAAMVMFVVFSAALLPAWPRQAADTSDMADMGSAA